MRANFVFLQSFFLAALVGSTAWAQASGAGSGGAGAGGAGSGSGASVGGAAATGGLGRVERFRRRECGSECRRPGNNRNPADVNQPLGGTGAAQSTPPVAEAAGIAQLQARDATRNQSRLGVNSAGPVQPTRINNMLPAGSRLGGTTPVPGSALAPDVRAPGAPASTASANTVPHKLSSDWRYVSYNGSHWYWMPNNTWRIWHTGQWRTVNVLPGATQARRLALRNR